MNKEIIEFISKNDKQNIFKKIKQKRSIQCPRYDFKMNVSYCLGVVYSQKKIDSIKNLELLKYYKNIEKNLTTRQETMLLYHDYVSCQEFEKGMKTATIDNEIQQLVYDLLFTPDKLYLMQELGIKNDNAFRSIIIQYTGYCYRNNIDITNHTAVKILNNYKNNKIQTTALKEFNNEQINGRRKYK